MALINAPLDKTHHIHFKYLCKFHLNILIFILYFNHKILKLIKPKKEIKGNKISHLKKKNKKKIFFYRLS